MRESKQSVFIQNILVLIAVIGLIVTGWLAGHILRYSNPMFWHQPIEETNPRIKTGFEFEFEGIRRLAVLPGDSQRPQVRIYLGEGQINLIDECVGNTYYTSLPAKCRSVDGRLVRVGGVEPPIILIPRLAACRRGRRAMINF